jgi:hypothetical protein
MNEGDLLIEELKKYQIPKKDLLKYNILPYKDDIKDYKTNANSNLKDDELPLPLSNNFKNNKTSQKENIISPNFSNNNYDGFIDNKEKLLTLKNKETGNIKEIKSQYYNQRADTYMNSRILV